MYVLFDYGDFINGRTSNTARSLRSTSPHDGCCRGARRLRRDATGHHGLAATLQLHDQFGLVIRRRRLLREVQNPDLRRCRGCGRSGVLARGVARDATSGGGVPTAVRACPAGDMQMHYVTGAQQRTSVWGPVDTSDMISHSQMRSSVCIGCMHPSHPIPRGYGCGLASGWPDVDLL